MTSARRHLFFAIGFGALAMLCLGLVTWALVEGAVVANFPSDAQVRSNTAGHQYQPANTVYSREEAPGRYWLVVGLLGFFGTLFTVVAVLERNSFRVASQSRLGDAPIPGLLAKIDRACGLYPEGRDALLRARQALGDVNSPSVAVAIDTHLEKVLDARDRETAMREIQDLSKALDMAGRFRDRSAASSP